ncbi:MAG: hypothetical protein SOZ58_12070 [Prevotella sp.]|nr:hypothetical protein [Prevotella sp.]
MKLDGRRMSDNISDRRGERMNMAGGGMGLLRLLAILPGGIKTKLIGLAVVAAVVLATQGTYKIMISCIICVMLRYKIT